MIVLIYDNNRQETIRSTIYLSALVIFVTYIILNTFMPNADLNLIVGMVQIVAATMVLCFYIPRALYAVFVGSTKPTDFLIVGIVLSWVSVDGQAHLALLARLSNYSPVLMNSEAFGFFKLLSLVAALCHVAPKGAVDGVVPNSNKKAIIGFFVVSAILATALVLVKPDPTFLIDRTPGWMRDFWSTGALQTNGAPPA